MGNIFKKAKALIKRFELIGLGKVETISIPKIPKEWEEFPNSGGDKWVGVKFPDSEKTESCIYIAKKGSIFPLHKHTYTELVLILNVDGKIEAITDTEVKTIKFGESVFFKENKIHGVKFITDTKMLCIWEGKECGWDAKIIIE